MRQIFITFIFVTNCYQAKKHKTSKDISSISVQNKKTTTDLKLLESEVEIQGEKLGQGDSVTIGKTVHVHYKAYLEGKNETFDDSSKRNMPFSFTLGEGIVIKGFEEGVLGMKPGGHRKIRIPSALAYGELGISNVIPPNQPLVFEIALLKVE